MRMSNPIAPICEGGRILILGTFPGGESLKAEFYYWHPQNRFWKVLAGIYNEPGFLQRDKHARKQLVVKHRLALWDTVESCLREGSLDQNIKDPAVIDLAGFLESNPSIRRIILNGTKAAAIYKKYFINSVNVEYFACPSTSPANARFKIDLWRDALTKPFT